MKKLLVPNTTLPIGLDLLRMLCGGIIFSFGLEIFNAEQMAGYEEWLTSVGMTMPAIMGYVGKIAELVCGIGLCIGFVTRLSAIPLMLTMIVINFIMLDGTMQTPFFLLIIFAIFFFLGSGRLSVDALLFKEGVGRK